MIICCYCSGLNINTQRHTISDILVDVAFDADDWLKGGVGAELQPETKGESGLAPDRGSWGGIARSRG